MNKLYIAQQFRRALEMFVQTITDESTMMEVADVYPMYEVGKAYKEGDVFRCGVNADGESQLYQVLQDHTSAVQWPPEGSVSLYKKVGVTDDGIPIWTQPIGASDAYQDGDVVMHDGSKWRCTVGSNVWEPGTYGWEKIE